MWPRTTSRLSIAAVMIAVAISAAGCPGGGGNVGDLCNNSGECDSSLQCLGGVCVQRCQRAPDCGDGYTCDGDGLCRLATGQPGDTCSSEVDCAPGLACQIDGSTINDRGRLLASCTVATSGRPPGNTCSNDNECRNGTCALGRCVDLCRETRDCSSGTSCMAIPRVEASGALFDGCLASKGDIAWTIPIAAPTANIMLPVPSAAQSAQLVFTVDDPTQRVGAERLVSPDPVSALLYTKPCVVGSNCPGPNCCTVDSSTAQYFNNIVRHLPDLEQSVLGMPSTPNAALATGAYRVKVSSYRPNGDPGSAIPHVTAVVRIDSALLLDLHFHFLDLDGHPCDYAYGNAKLDATSAQTIDAFKTTYLDNLRTIFAHGGIALGDITYHDVLDHPALDGLDVGNAGALLSLGEHAGGVDIFFVRTLSPVGLQAFGPNPGPAGLAGTRQSGIVIGVDTLCYRSWEQLARLTAHELARYMGLYHNVERTTSTANIPYRDHIDDSDDASSNLMFYSELGGTDLSPGQREILTRSGVLR